MYDHLQRCKLVPEDVKLQLMQLKELSSSNNNSNDGNSNSTPDSEQNRAFYDLIWTRLNRVGDITT